MRRPVQTNRITGLLDDRRGLSSSEVEQRRSLYGYNEIVESRPTGWRDVRRLGSRVRGAPIRSYSTGVRRIVLRCRETP